MTIYISEENRICHLQAAFRERYPFLKLEFYMQPHGWGESCPSSQLLDPQTPVEKIRIIHTFGTIDIDELRTAGELEYDFRHHFGMSVQVFQQTAEGWLATTEKDGWSLGRLNSESAAVCNIA